MSTPTVHVPFSIFEAATCASVAVSAASRASS